MAVVAVKVEEREREEGALEATLAPSLLCSVGLGLPASLPRQPGGVCHGEWGPSFQERLLHLSKAS